MVDFRSSIFSKALKALGVSKLLKCVVVTSRLTTEPHNQTPLKDINDVITLRSNEILATEAYLRQQEGYEEYAEDICK